MEIIGLVVDIFIHLDTYPGDLIVSFGSWTYILLFSFVFL